MERPVLNLFNAQTADDVRFCVQRGDDINEYFTQNEINWGQNPADLFHHFRYNWKKPIDVASTDGNLEVFRALVENGAYYGFDENRHIHPLYYAISYGNSNILNEYIHYLNFDVNSPIMFENSCLDIACKRDHIDIIDILLYNGANREGLSLSAPPLMSAIRRSNDIIVIKLLEEFLDIEGSVPAVVNRKVLNGQPIFMKCSSEKILDILYVHGLDINMTDDYDETFLHEVCEHFKHNIGLLKKCLKYGADPTIKNEYGDTPLHNLMRHLYNNYNTINIKAIKNLIKYGADINDQNVYGDTPLHVYLEDTLYRHHNEDMLTIVTFLINLGASIDIENEEYITARSMMAPFEIFDKF